MFKAGDLVRCTTAGAYSQIKKDKVYAVLHGGVCGSGTVRIHNDSGVDYFYESNLFELVTEKENTVTTEKKPHKHRDLIIAWANGATIQARIDKYDDWEDVYETYWYEDWEYRIKPEPKPDQFRTMFVELHPKLDNAYNKPNIKLTFDGETEKLKAVEIINND